MLKYLRIYLFGSGCVRMPMLLYFALDVRKKGYRRLAAILFRKLEREYGVYIGVNAKIGENVRFPHPVGIVIGDGVEIGGDCTIFQNVTVGGARIGDAQNCAYPKIGNNVVLFAGAVVVGAIEIGEQCVIGANSVVNRDFPSGSVIAGVPARKLNW